MSVKKPTPPPGDARFRPDLYSPNMSRRDLALKCERAFQQLSLKQRQHLEAWLAIGRTLPWTHDLTDPPFSVLSFRICEKTRELCDVLMVGGWALGQAFVLDDICCIQQPTNDWLAIKGETPFTSIMDRHPLERERDARQRLQVTIEAIRAATEDQCRRLEYAQSYLPLETAVITKRLEPRRGLTLSYSLPGEQEEYCVQLSAGLEDQVDILSSCGRVFVVSTNPRIGYAGLEVLRRRQRLEEVFLQPGTVEARFGPDFWEFGVVERLKELLEAL